MMLLGKIALGAAGAVLVAGTMVFSQGAITVQVNERGDDGRQVNLFLPAAAVPLAMRMVPAHHFGQIPPEAQQALPAVCAAARLLARQPDFVLVEVESPREHVRIEKKGSRLVVHVTERDEEVYVAVPLRTIASVLQQLERAAEQNRRTAVAD
jgi:hypothetical protein